MALSNEVGRRLDSYSSSMPDSERVDALDKFSQKLVNSGHTIKTIRTILVGGIKGYKRKVAICAARSVPLHRSAGQSASSRRTKKLLAKSQWFRTTSNDQQDDYDVLSHGNRVADGGGSGTRQISSKESKAGQESKPEVRTTTVIFVELSKGGAMQKRLRDCLDRITPKLGFKVRVT